VTDPCAPRAAQGSIVTSFTYGTLTGNEDGNGFARGKSSTFDWGAATNQYYVNIHDPVTCAPIACGVLTRKAPKPHPPGQAARLRGSLTATLRFVQGGRGLHGRALR
jgi:hypothetical protein